MNTTIEVRIVYLFLNSSDKRGLPRTQILHRLTDLGTGLEPCPLCYTEACVTSH